MKRIFLSMTVLVSAVAIAFTLLSPAAMPAKAQSAGGALSYKADPAHTSIAFEVGHLGISHIYGLFTNNSGQFTIDKDHPAASSFEIATQAASLFTGVQKRDAHLQSPDFFSVAEFPTITFKSATVTPGLSAGTFQVTGDLTLHGVTKSITVNVQILGEVQWPKGANRTGVVTDFIIKRSDYGMTSFPGVVSDEVHLMIGVEGVRQ